jgi:UDP-N-acetylmuramyl pentapeptide phosphotransferase/UDP-N-acetylglucosamine-1-phosphate transferase
MSFVTSESIGAFVISVFGVALVLWYARSVGLLDIPNQRSSHSVPTPRGGGIALVASVLLVGSYDLARADGESLRVLFVILGASLALTWVGWLDDHRSTPAGLRLAVHLACGFAIGLLVNDIAPMPGLANIPWIAWWVFWTVGSINIVNFMDGVDGMIASQAVIYGAYLFLVLSGSSIGGRYGLILCAASLGFLVWNWAPAKMFMGDVGSGPLGFFFVVGGALAVREAPVELVFLPLFPLFLDALVTILIRFRRGERLTDAHRSHLYQRLANGGFGHARVAAIYAFAAGVGAMVALALRNGPPTYRAAGVFFYIVLVVIGWVLLHERFVDAPITGPPQRSVLED